jgi:DNA polymerase/3'-5' exonuclease PolX
MELKYAENIARKCVSLLSPFCDRIEVAGSIRRQKQVVNDIEIVSIPSSRYLRQYVEIVNSWYKVIGKAYAKYTRRKLENGIYLDLFHASPQNWGLIFAIRTGSAKFSQYVLANGWVKKGYHSSGGILIDLDGRAKFIYEEEDLFKLIGIPYIEPYLRDT